MSGIVFGSLHRKLNGKPIDLEGQLKRIYAAVAEVKTKESRNTQRALKSYNKYKEGDTIVVRMPVNSNNNATQHLYPEDSGWIYNDSIDLLIKGLITSKSELRDTSNMSIKLKILSMNREDVKVLMRDVNVGDEIESDLKLDIIEDVNTNN